MTSNVHRVRYYNPKPQPISCGSLNKSTKQLALARGDASIEIWDMSYSPYLLKFLPSIENSSVEALCWVEDRLLSTGLSGALVEWDLEYLVIKNTMMLTGHAAWCLDVTPDNTLVAAGTEQGFVNLYNVENGSFTYEKLFDKQEGRVLCCKFNTTGQVLATGSINTIRVWNVTKGQATSRISVRWREQNVIVWSLAFVSESTLVSGDSLGKLTFWDTDMGDQIETFATHRADITCIAVSDDESNLYCGGVDPVILHFTKVAHSTDNTSKAKMQWVKNVQRHIHEHDVRVLLMLGDRELISAGVDGYLTLSSYPPKWIMRVPPMLPPPRSAVCTKKKLLLLRFSNYLEVWKLGSYDKNESGHVMKSFDNGIEVNEENPTAANNVEQDSTDAMYLDASLTSKNICLKITERPTKLLSIQTKKKMQLLCCELSPTGQFIFYSTSSNVRLLKLETDDYNIFVSKLPVSGVKAPCDRVAFSDDSRLLVAHMPGALHVTQVDADVGATTVQTIKTDKYFKAKTLLHLLLSSKTPNGATYLVAADTKSGIAVWTLKGTKFEIYATLPTNECVPSAMSIDSRQGLLYIAYVDQTIVEYELNKKMYATWPASVMPESWRARTAAVHSVSAHSVRNAVVLQDQNSFWVVEKSLEPQQTSNKRRKDQNTIKDIKLNFKIVPVKYLAGFHWLDNNEAVTIELLPSNILALLPPVVAHKKH